MRKVIFALPILSLLFIAKGVLAANVVIDPATSSVDLLEGAAAYSYGIVLDSQPQNDVAVIISSTAPLQLNQNLLTFTSDNWNATQTVSILAPDDGIYTGNRLANVSYTVSSTDTNFSGLAIPNFSVNVLESQSAPIVPFSISLSNPTPADGSVILQNFATLKIYSTKSLNSATINLGLANGDFELGNLNGWTNSGWVIDSVGKRSGNYGIKSAGNSSILSRTIVAPTSSYVSFYWKASAMTSINFYLDGVLVASNKGISNGWEQQKFDLTTGEHKIKFIFSKLQLINGSGALDNITLGSIDGIYPLSLNNDQAEISLNSLPEGTVFYSVSAGSGSDTTSTAWQSFVVDTKSPIAIISNLPEPSTTATTASFKIIGEGLISYKYKLDSGAWSQIYPITTNIDLGVSLGSHCLSVIGADNHGRWQPENSPTNFSWKVVTNIPTSGGGSTGGSSGPILPTSSSDQVSSPTTTTSSETSNVATNTPSLIEEGRVLGVKIYADQSLLKVTSTNKVYLISQEQRKLLTTKELKKYKNKKIITVTAEEINQYPDWRSNNSLLKTKSGKIFLLKDGKKTYISSLKELKKYKKNKVYKITDQELGKYSSA